MKYLLLLSLLLFGCTNKPKIQIGMTVTNGYCAGLVVDFINSDTVKLEQVNCGLYTLKYAFIKVDELREVGK